MYFRFCHEDSLLMTTEPVDENSRQTVCDCIKITRSVVIVGDLFIYLETSSAYHLNAPGMNGRGTVISADLNARSFCNTLHLLLLQQVFIYIRTKGSNWFLFYVIILLSMRHSHCPRANSDCWGIANISSENSAMPFLVVDHAFSFIAASVFRTMRVRLDCILIIECIIATEFIEHCDVIWNMHAWNIGHNQCLDVLMRI